MTGNEPHRISDTEWNEIIEHAKEIARDTAKEYVSKCYASQHPEQTQPTHTIVQYQEEIELITKGLERYRTEPPESNIRKCIDWLIRKHATLQDCYTGSEREFYRKKHNALILRYIIATPMTLNQIGKRLKTSCYGAGNILEKGINDLAQIFFWYIEQAPDIRKNKVSCNNENSTSPICHP